MKFWPQKRWKQVLLVAILAFIVIVGSVLGFILFKINSDYTSEIQVINPDGNQSALIIYHPGLSSFMKDSADALADGLVENDWRVEITTASSQAPTDLSEYSLFVLGSPVYGDNPSETIKRHLERIGDLEEIPTVLLVTSAGSDGGAEATMQLNVEEHNGMILQVVSLYTTAPNEGDRNPLDLAKQAGTDLVIE